MGSSESFPSSTPPPSSGQGRPGYSMDRPRRQRQHPFPDTTRTIYAVPLPPSGELGRTTSLEAQRPRRYVTNQGDYHRVVARAATEGRLATPLPSFPSVLVMGRRLRASNAHAARNRFLPGGFPPYFRVDE
jgi:hypothetical protein